MRSLAKKHKAKALAKVHAEKTKADAKKTVAKKAPTGLADQSFDVVLAQFNRHCEQLKALENINDKVEFKKNVLPDYVTYLDGYLNKGQQYPNPVLSRLLFWLIDVDDIPNAYKFGALALDQQQIKPEGFKRDLATAFVETLHDWCERQFKAGQSAEPFLTNTCNHCIQSEWIVSEIIVLNKLYKLRALYAEVSQDWETAVVMFEHCVAVNPEKHGVKTKLLAAKANLQKQKNGQ